MVLSQFQETTLVKSVISLSIAAFSVITLYIYIERRLRALSCKQPTQIHSSAFDTDAFILILFVKG